MPFAKFQTETSVEYFVGRVLRNNGTVTANPTEENLREAGYLPVVEAGEPATEEGKICQPHYEVQNGAILLTYVQESAEDAV